MINKIFLGDRLLKLDNIIQWQDKNVIRKESVSQHSYKVVLFTRVYLDSLFEGWLNYMHDYIIRKSVDLAIFHDWDEAFILRDLSHDLKYNKFNGEEIRKAVDKYVKHSMIEEFGSTSIVYSSFHQDDEVIKSIVKLADWVSLLYFINNEINNKILIEEKNKCEENIVILENKIRGILEKNDIPFNKINIL